MNVTVLFINYGPYHLARLNGFHRLCCQMGWNVTAMELARAEATYAWEASVANLPYPFVTVYPSGQLQQAKLPDLVWRLLKQLAQSQPDVVAIAGYGHPTLLAALLWSRLKRKPVVLLSATWEQDISGSGWKPWLKRWLIRRYQAALVGGEPQKRYLQALGMSSALIATGYNVVEGDAFHPSRIRELPKPIQRPFFLAVVRFIPEKNLPTFLAAYAQYCQQAGDQAWDLALCGDGPLRSQVETAIATYQLQDHVHLPGFLQQAALMPYFAHAGCLVLASVNETWGLVVNEAMAAALPVLASTKCGCCEDLILDGINGFSFEPDDVPAMVEAMLKISRDPETAKVMGEAALHHIQKFSPDYFAQGLAQAIQQAFPKSHPPIPLKSGN